MSKIKLSICICSIHERAPLLMRLLQRLKDQQRISETQILIRTDAGQELIGVKRNYLVNDALGDYVVHIDDDDLVHPKYVPKILSAIDSFPGVDVIALRGVRHDVRAVEDAITFDYRLMQAHSPETHNGVMWRSPGHLCPLRNDLARATMFPETEPEDLQWVAALGPKLKTLARAGDPDEVLYYYLWDSQKIYRWR